MKTIKKGDWVMNVNDPLAEPKQVKEKNGVLGVDWKGWFDWMPLRSFHKKVDKH